MASLRESTRREDADFSAKEKRRMLRIDMSEMVLCVGDSPSTAVAVHTRGRCVRVMQLEVSFGVTERVNIRVGSS